MTIEVKVAQAETQFSELLSKVEAGEDVIISRGNAQVARLVRIDDVDRRKKLVQLMRKERSARSRVTLEEILAWRDEGRRY